MYVAPFDVFLSDTDVVQPDVLFISRARAHTLTDENVRGAPDLVIEILSPSTADRDLGYKDLYGGTACEYDRRSAGRDRRSIRRDGRSNSRPSVGGTPCDGAALQLKLDDIFAS